MRLTGWWSAARTARVLAAVLWAAGATELPAQPAVGTITGRVTEQGPGQPVPEVQIFLVGTTLGGRSGPDGTYTIRNVPAGAVRVRAIRIGYTERTQAATVQAGQTATVDFALVRSAVQLQEIVTTATGEARRSVEEGNVVNTISAAQVTQTAPVTNVSDVLNARAPGVVITSGSGTGVGSRIRIRGANSLSLSNDPIYIIDGIRMTNNAGSTSLGTGGPEPSRVNDINPDEIENIEVVKGPSAATLYGTDAANGVIVITTKRGRAGPARWNVWAEGGLIEDRVNNYPTNYTLTGHSPGSTTNRVCTLPQVGRGACVADSVRSYSVFGDPDATPIGQGNRYQAGLSVAGGTPQVQYFLSGEREEENGLIELPAFERRRFDSLGVARDEWLDRPNALDKRSFRANLNAAVTSNLDVAVNAAYINLNQRYQLDMNATAGLGSHLFGGPGYKDNGTVSGLGTPLNGYRAWTPGYTFQERSEQNVNRFITGAVANYRPLSWLHGNATVGIDYTGRNETRLRRDSEGPPLTATYRDGFAGDYRGNIRNFTSNVSATASFQPRPWLNSQTAVGVQYVNYQLDQNSATGTDLPPGTVTVGAAANPGSSEATTITKTLGAFVEQRVGLNERLYLTAALRSDQNSAFGTDFQSVVYPKASVSWIASDEPFFPTIGWLDQLRLRAAYGTSGVQPGPNDALRTFGATTANIGGTDLPGVQFAALGNSELRPEETAEFETGFDARLFRNRTSFELTYYHKRTKDALIDAIVPPSLGAAATVVANIGSVRNKGFEALLTAQLVDRPAFGLDVNLNASTNDNKVVSLGETAPQIGTATRVVADYPLSAFWARAITGWEDKNNDGIIIYSENADSNEIFVADSATYLGVANPKHNVSLTTGIELFGRRLRLSTLVDWRGGFLWYNNTERIRCVSRQNCNGLMNPEASLEEQAMVVATRDHPSRTLAGFFQEGDFVRLRELSATYSVPDALLGRLRGVRSASLNLSARNLALWTKYRGIDPESFRDAGSSANTGDDFQGLGPPSYYVLRLNVGF